MRILLVEDDFLIGDGIKTGLEKLGFKKVAILHDNSAYAKGLADEARQRIMDKKSADIVFLTRWSRANGITRPS